MQAVYWRSEKYLHNTQQVHQKRIEICIELHDSSDDSRNVHFAKCCNKFSCSIIIKAETNQVKLKKIRTSGQNEGVSNLHISLEFCKLFTLLLKLNFVHTLD